MGIYFMASIRIKDVQEYQSYLDGSDEVFRKYKGSYLAVDSRPDVLEGTWDYSRAVLIRFETRDDFEAWYTSPEYQEILGHRLSASECDTILIEGA